MREVAEKVFAEQGVTVDYLVGTMIEIPRAALTADQIAEVAEFFSFGTNDLTQMTLGVSRDDAGKFLPLYTSEALEIWPADPFATLDQEGVGQLVEMGIEKGRSTRPQLKVGICGEHGGDPETVKFCHRARHGLRELLAVPRAGGAPGRGPGRHRGERRPAAGEVGHSSRRAPARAAARRARAGAYRSPGEGGHPLAKLGRDIEVTLADGRELRVRDARRRDALPVTRLLDAVAGEPQVTLILRPGEARQGDWRRRIADATSSPRGLFLVAESRGAIAGNLGLWPDANPASAHVAWLGMSVAAGYRGVGVGGAILEAALEWAARAGYRRAVLGVFPDNVRAIAFYERQGFVREGLRRAQYRRGDQYHDEVLMARSLTPEA